MFNCCNRLNRIRKLCRYIFTKSVKIYIFTTVGFNNISQDHYIKGNKAIKHFLRHTTKLPIKNWVVRIEVRSPFL